MEFAVTAFMDILGYANMVEEDSVSPEQKHLPRILNAMKGVREHAQASTFNTLAFSDSVILECSFNPNQAIQLIDVVAAVQRSFLREGILLRGGIAFGKHYRDPTLLYSKALVEAYRLERTEARFPRVLLDRQNLLDWLRNHPDLSSEKRQQLNSQCLQDQDQRIFVSYCTLSFVEEHHQLVQNYLSRTSLGADSVLEKAQWLVRYHNHLATQAGRTDLILTPPWGFAPFQ